MKKYRSNALLGRKYNFRTASLLLALLVATFNLSVFAQEQAEAVTNKVIVETTDLSPEKNAKQGEIVDSVEGAQVASNYVFATTTGGSLTDMSSGTTTLVAADQDDTASAVTNIGFDFYFQGVRYTQFSVNSNGSIRLGATAVSTTLYDPLGQVGQALITAYGADQRTHAGNGKVHFKVSGVVGSRVLVIEWLNTQADFNAGGTADLTYQARLFETTGVIEFVYGSTTMSTAGAADPNSNSPQIGFSSSNVVGTVGSVTAAQSGTPAPTFNSGAATPTNNLYTAGTIPVLTSAVDGSRRTFSFTPPVPTAPSGLNFTAVGPISQTLNWTDNSGNELGFVIYRSTDGVNYSFIGQTAANATSYTDTGLTQSTNYFYQVYAVTEGALSSPVLSGSQATAAGGIDTCNGAGGLWSVPATWADGSVPTATDNVTISSGCTVTIDIASNALTLNVLNNGILQYETTTARTLTVGTSVTIATGGTFQSAATGTVTTHILSVGTDLTNNGTLDFSTNANTAGAGITFTGATNNTFGGTGATTDVRAVTVNKGTSNANILEVTTNNFTVQGVATDVAGFLTLTNGTFKLSGTFTVTNRVFTAAAYTIGATTGFWLNNPNFTVAGQAGSPTVSGLFRMTQGTFNIGTGTGNSMGFSTGSTIVVEGGAVNAVSRFGVAAAGNAITYTQTAGTITVNTIGNASATLGSFDVGTSLSSSITISGGTIVAQLAATAIDYRNQAGGGVAGLTGGTLQFGNASSGAAKAFSIRGVAPNVVMNNTSAGHTATWSTTLVNYNNLSLNITINTGNTLNLGNVLFLFAGTTLTNNGTLTHNGASSNFITFNAVTPVTYTGSGTVTAPLTALSLQSDLGITFDPASPNIVVSRINVFTGGITNANKLTLGTGGATTGVIQIGNTTTPTAAGTFDVPLTFNLGTGGENISYLRTTALRTTGGEINPARILTNLTYDDNDTTHTLTIAGGDLTVTGALALTNGIILTGTNTLIHNGAATRTTGFVAGNLSRAYSATGAYTYFVGDNTGTPEYSPMTANVTATTAVAPSSLTVSVVDALLPGLNAAQSASRYWTLTETGDLTADLAFTYLDSDISGDETMYKVFRREAGVTLIYAGGNTNNAATNTATVTGVSDFSDWGIGNAPTAAGVNVGGRVVTSAGRGIAGARVYLTDGQGNVTVRQTNGLGYYRFVDVAAGGNYIMTAEHKAYKFPPSQLYFISGEELEINFVAGGGSGKSIGQEPDKRK